METGYDRFAGRVRPLVAEPLLGQYARALDGVGHQVVGEQHGKPDILVLASVTDVARTLRTSATVGDWITGNMFVPDTTDRAMLNELELAAINEVGALTEVCRRPHDRLDSTTELVRASLARRVPPGGLTRLASHTEDWAGVEHGQIHPLRLVSLRYVEHLDFYENRVAAQLVDRLREHLSRRIRELTTLADGLADLDEYEQSLRRTQSWRKLERLSKLVAHAVSDAAAPSALIQDSLRELRRVRTKILALRDSIAYRHASRRAHVPMRLVRTNLFSNDGRYRRVGSLWDRWAVHETKAKELQREVDESFLESYDAYVAALTVRACGVLGFTPIDPDAPVPTAGSAVQLHSPSGELTCSLDQDGGMRVLSGDQVLVRVLAIGHDLSAAAPDSVVRDWIDRVDEACSASPTPLVVAYPGLRSSRAGLPGPIRRRVHSTGPHSRTRARSQELIAIVPITPLEIEGEERLARALRWTVLGLSMVRQYPLTLSTGARRPQLTADWFRTSGKGGELELLRRPSAMERALLLQSFDDHGRRSGGLRASRQEEFLRELAGSLDACAAQFDLFQTCPLCAGSATALQPRDRDTFHCRCESCETFWGTRVCGPCGERYPILWPKNAVVDAGDEDRLDMTAGADILALPCPTAVPGTRFRCPWCKHCAGMPGCGCTLD
ncbi:DUF2357 domain-containing protein [Micromonospora aurantiaca (nom. illeg.)]|uniref:DUF2357 domain-containing protein n=1 Tax=Micromonospora aurantiaca (nom. illeg.) TaxID=47850 RepID=UPI003F4A120E